MALYLSLEMFRGKPPLEMSRKLLDNIVVCREICRNISKFIVPTQPATTYSKLNIETLEQGVKYVQS